jgi:putative NADH-flavin reductase
MKVALIGATGQAGSRLLQELTHRGHSVTAIARNPNKVPQSPLVAAKRGDVREPNALSAALRGHDVVISSVRFVDADPAALVGVVRAAGVKRYLVVGGAASLEVAPSVTLLSTPQFPAAYKEEASRGAAFLEYLRGVEDLDWTFLSPSALFVAGERTGKFRLGKDQLLANEDGSRISFEDFAIAMVDEIEKPAHIRERFTVGY